MDPGSGIGFLLTVWLVLTVPVCLLVLLFGWLVGKEGVWAVGGFFIVAGLGLFFTRVYLASLFLPPPFVVGSLLGMLFAWGIWGGRATP